MADVNANIDINIDSSNALAQLKALQRQISQFHTSIAKSSETAALAQKGLQKNLLNSINAISGFTAEMRTVKTSAESFTDSLEKNKFSMREYFRYAGASTKTFGRLFKSEFDTIGKVAEERVKRLQTQYIKMGRDTNGAMKAMGIMPTQLNMSDYTTKVQIAAQKQALFNQLMKQGSTNLLNFGKNTQWAGRQLMVGFTLPLMLVGSTASKAFMDMEAQALKFKKVYGDLFTPQGETQQVLDNITELGKQFTKYGVAVSATVGLAAEAAAAGFQGLDLQRQTTEATRLSILGQIDSQKALETTISLQNAFGMSSEKLADSINFLNAVENQTVVSLDDITTAIPKVAPVIQQLGGDVKDLTFFIAAMKEGGINASEGANALKSGLAALINPTGKASDMLAQFGINARKIVVDNKGDLKATVIEFATALNQLDPLNRAQAIEQMFGKFQFARLSTLFANVAKDGNQASRVLDLANSSVEQLSALSEKELGMTADSAMNKFKKSVEDLKVALIPVGQAFLEAATPIIEFVGNILEKFANLSAGTKKLITLLTVGIGAVGPILLMTFGLLANGIANIIKLFLTLRGGYQRLTGQTSILGEQTQYMTMEQLDAAAAAHSLNQTHAKLTQTFTAERTAVNQLISAYNSAAGAARNFAMSNPGMMMPGRGARKFADGIVSVPGSGNKDTVPAMLTPGESVIPAKMTKKYAPLIQGMIADNIPGFKDGRGVSSASGMVFAHGAPGGNLSPQIIQQLSLAVSQSVNRHLQQATRVKGFSNFGFLAPEKLNQGKMSGAEGGQFFGQNAELATSRIYKSIVDLLPAAVSDPSVKQDVVLFGKNIGEQLALAGSKAVSEPDFYNAVANALEKTMTQATTQAFKESLPKIQKQITTIAAFGGDINRGDRGQRISLSRASQQKGLGYEKGMVSYKGQTLTSQLKKQGFSQGQQSLTPIDRIRAQTAGTGGGANMIAGVRAGQQAKYDKQDAAILEAMGIKSARSAITATEREAQVASPSRRTRKIGQDIARGLEVGMADRQDDVALAGSQLSQAATGGIRGGSRQVPFRAPGQPGYVASNVPKSAGVNLSDITSKARMNRDALLSGQQQKRMSEMNTRMDRLNRGFMSGTFALSALSGVASMAGGNLGKFSEILFQISGPLFAISSIVQLLTGEKILKTLKKIGMLRFGAAAVAIGAFIVATKLINNAREKERLKIEGLGDAATLTSKKMKTLGDLFGVKTGPSAFERLKTQKTDIQVGTKQRSAIEEVRGSKEFQKDFKNDISTLKTATQEQAQLIFESIAIQLKGSGFANEQINNIIKALQLEANKTNVKIDLKNVDLTTEAGQATLNKNIKALTDSVGTTFNKGMKTTYYRVFEDGKMILKPFTELGDEAKKSIDFASKAITANIVGLSAQLESGVIDAKQFSSAFESISNNIRSMPKPQSVVILNNLMKNLPEDLVKSAEGINNVSYQLLLLQGQAAGLAATSNLINAMLTLQKGSADSVERREAVATIVDYKNSINQVKEAWKGLNSETDPFKEIGTPGKQANDQLSTIKNYFSAREALIKQERQLEEDALQASIDGTQKRIDKEQELIDINQRSIDLLSRKIEIDYDRKIQKLQDESTVLNNTLETIRKEEDAINKQYDTQIKALEKISSINQEIADGEKSRLNIADALSSGDISAAAEAVQNARAQFAASRLDQQTKALEASRQQSLVGITVNGMTKDQIEARTYAISQQVFSLEQQRKILQDQVVVLQDKNYETEQSIYKIKQDSLIPQQTALDTYQKSTTALIEGQLVLGKTQKEWEIAEGKVNLYNAGLDLSNTKLTGMDKLLASIAKKWATLQSGSLAGLVSGPENGSSGTGTSSTGSVAAKNAGLVFGAGMSRMYGGMVPKYLARGGRVGSDTIPAMLTPGEFVMNRKATEQFGPILSMLNESKYPSMIGNKGIPQIPINNISTSANDNSTAVYNYNLGFSINGANSNANDIARAVMKEIKNVNSQKVRGQRQ
jgi:TP901 family phage tail tape measure protein